MTSDIVEEGEGKRRAKPAFFPPHYPHIRPVIPNKVRNLIPLIKRKLLI
jgi:hypothetical protein